MTVRLVTAAMSGLLVALAGAVPSVAAEEENAPAAEAQAANFSTDQLDQIVAPVALYPDSLLMQVFIASAYPLEVVEADRWRRQQGDLKGDALDKAVADQDWDPSIKGLTQFPDVLKRMSDNLDWTKDMGDAFLGQKDDVFAAVQRMRKRAADAGSLKTSKEQTVTTETVNNKETIVIQPADPQVVYAPQYAPSAVYGSYAPPAPYYPATYGYTPGAMAATGLLSFGLGVGVGALVSDGCDWGHGNVYVNGNYGGGWGGGGNNVNVNKNVNKTNVAGNRQNWKYNPEHRRNVGYRDQATARRYGGSTGRTAAQRQDLARGFQQTGAGARGGRGAEPAARSGASGAAARAPGAGTRTAQERGAGAASRRSAGVGAADRQGRAADGGRQGAFGGYENGRATQQVSQRGAASRGGQSWAGGGQRGGGGRGGGGGGFGGGGGRGGGGGARGGGGGRGGGGRRR